MYKKIMPIVISFFIISISFSAIGEFQYSDTSNENEIWHLIRIKDSIKNKDFIHHNHFEIAGYIEKTYIDIIVNKQDLPLFEKSHIDYTIVIHDLNRLFNENRGEYHTFPEMVNILQNIANDHPSITDLFSIGTSWEGREIWCLEISDNPGVDEGEPEIFFMGLHHAREWPTMEICLHIADELTNNYGSDPDVSDVVNNRRLWIVPCENPDGYVYSHDQGHNMWRKNRRYFPEYSSYGVDANRNYGGSNNGDPWGSWGSIGEGSVTHDPDDDTYCGPWSMSENCTQAIVDFYKQHDMCASISWHTYSEYVMWPWGYSQNEITPDNTYISQVGTEIANRITQQDGTGTYLPMQSSDLYPTTGDTTDWAYGYYFYEKGKTHFAYTIEACTSFFPSESYLDQICEENYDGAFYLLQEAENIDIVTPQVLPPVLDEMATDDDGEYTITWTEENPLANPDYFQLDELTNLTIHTDDGESGSGFWTLNGFSQSSSRSHSGTYSYKSRYANEDVSAMVTNDPLIVTSDMELSFWCWYDIEENYDMAFVEVSTDGRSYTLLDTFTGSSNGWTYKEYDLQEWNDQSIFIRFRYTTDSYTQDEGFYVDDIQPVPTYDSITTLSNSISTHSYTVTGRNPGLYYYRVKGHNTERGWGDFSILESMNVTDSGDAITISHVNATPRLQETPGWVNMSCSVTATKPISSITIQINKPNNQILNQSMNLVNNGQYYFNSSFNQLGRYSYYIFAEDNNGNAITSSTYFFYIGENYTNIALETGWNLLTIPDKTNWSASNLANNISGCTSVSKWNASLQTYDTYIVGGPPSFDFMLCDGCGYFVDVIEESTFSVTGESINEVNVSLEVGWNLLGWYHEDETTASSLASNISGCTSVSKWNASLQTYDTFIVGGPPSFDFMVSCGMGLFVDVTEQSYWHGEG